MRHFRGGQPKGRKRQRWERLVVGGPFICSVRLRLGVYESLRR